MNFYLTNSCINNFNLNTILIKPYEMGCKNIKRACLKNYTFNINQPVSSPTLQTRVSHLVVGLILLIPIINSFAITLLRIKEIKKHQIKKNAAIKIQCAFRQFEARKAKKILVKAKEVAKQKAAEEAKLKAAEEAAKLKAIEEAKLKAEEDAKLQAIEEAKCKAEHAVKYKALLEAIKDAHKELEAAQKVQQEEAALVIQKAFRKWKTKNDAKKPKTKQKPLNAWQKTKSLLTNPLAGKVIGATTGINATEASACLSNLSEATTAVSKGNYKLAALKAAMATANVCNATLKFFLPPGYSEVNKANQFALPNNP